MRLMALLAIVALMVLPGPAGAGANDTQPAGTVWVYKPDGTQHCQDHEGVPLDAMARELAAAGVVVHAGRKGYDGREGIALCGTPTGQINLYRIEAAYASKAIGHGFKLLPACWTGHELHRQ